MTLGSQAGFGPYMDSAKSKSDVTKIRHTQVRRAALRAATTFEFSRVELQVFLNLIEWISFKDGFIDPNHEVDKDTHTYMENLGILHRKQITRAFKRLKELNLITTRRIKNTVYRSLSSFFFESCVNKQRDQPVPPQNAEGPTSPPSRDQPVPPEGTNESPPSLYRKKDGRMDERMDGREPPTIEGGKVSEDAVDYAKMFQDLYSHRLRFLPKSEFERYNAYVQKLLNKRGEAELGEILVFAAYRITRREPMDQRKFSLYEFQRHVADWDGSPEKETWLQSIREDVPDPPEDYENPTAVDWN